jgi:hypothetical protein
VRVARVVRDHDRGPRLTNLRPPRGVERDPVDAPRRGRRFTVANLPSR